MILWFGYSTKSLLTCLGDAYFINDAVNSEEMTKMNTVHLPASQSYPWLASCRPGTSHKHGWRPQRVQRTPSTPGDWLRKGCCWLPACLQQNWSLMSKLSTLRPCSVDMPWMPEDLAWRTPQKTAIGFYIPWMPQELAWRTPPKTAIDVDRNDFTGQRH